MSRYCSDCAFADFRYNNAPVGSGHSTFLCAKHNKFRNYGNVDCGEWKDRHKEAQDEVNNYRRHANECEGLAAKGDIDKVSLLEEIKELKNDKELLDSQLYGFLQLEEECGGGDLRNYIAELKADNERLKNKMDDYHLMSDNRRAKIKELKRALWLARANSAEGQFSYWCARFAVESGFTKTDIRGYTVNTKRKLRTIGEWIKTWKNVERRCRAKAEEYK